ncbi:MAG: hypothetical protein K1X92_18995, partial [Bacteroidia bacterium]|nr:hypothetical protein [Bacteroidia bacterium]
PPFPPPSEGGRGVGKPRGKCSEVGKQPFIAPSQPTPPKKILPSQNPRNPNSDNPYFLKSQSVSH